ncbi:MAG TPA: VCBS repeat-containing protein, partial [Cyclobacteriaceae bacterium]|nr:VCBS repeat-containing protein [Cyclobacteriaceae bacterium]
TPPELLDKTTWEKSILPEMAFRMGLPSPVISQKAFDDLQAVMPLIPGQPLVSKSDFELIEKYFLTLAPDSLAQPKKIAPAPLSQFEPVRVPLTENMPVVTMLTVDSSGRIFVGGRNNSLLVLRELSIAGKYSLESPTAFALPKKGSKLICLEMGIMDPNDKSAGKLVELSLDTRNTRTIIDSLKRPVYFEEVDLNGDHLDDFVICEFGNNTGKLEVFENLGNGMFNPHIIEASPGARKVVTGDFNGDGKKDIIALMTQADERIELYLGQGDFNFIASTMLRFPAVYGSSYFEIHDFNGDGFFDILYTNGDNSDYSMILKPYHGVRIFLNDGHQHFSESWFYPMHGASWAMASDFDQDGDLDIAAIAFFPDFKRSPEQAFIYFENRDGKFLPFVTTESICGRWLVMSVADIDHDHDQDILLGALDFKPSEGAIFDQWKKQPTSLLVLKNKLR